MAEFDDARIKRIVALAEQSNSKKQRHWDAQSIFNRLDEAIIGNDKYKKSLAICISDFIGDVNIRNHMLVVGGSGTGKTYLLEQCLPDFGIAFHIIDASSLVPAGIKGNTLKESLEEFFRSNMTASSRCVIVLDEFDKISEKANGGDAFKSMSIQSELLSLIQGKQEGAVDTRQSLWIFAGAFAYADEMKGSAPKITKNDLLKYGFKNELVGRIAKLTMTEIPSVEQVIKRAVADKSVKNFLMRMKQMGFQVDFTDEAFLLLATAAQDPKFGMRVIPSAVTELQEQIVFGKPKGKVFISKAMVERALAS